MRVLVIAENRVQGQLTPEGKQALSVAVVERGMAGAGWLALTPVVVAQR